MQETETVPAETVEQLRDKYLRALANIDNMSKRARKDIEQARDEGEAHVALAFLPLLDDFRRAVSAAAATSGDGAREQVIEGLSLLYGKFTHTLGQLQIEGFQSEGEKFTHEIMEAIAEIPTKLLPPGTVAAELEQGYKRRGKLLRPARVAVAVAPKEDGSEPDAS